MEAIKQETARLILALDEKLENERAEAKEMFASCISDISDQKDNASHELIELEYWPDGQLANHMAIRYSQGLEEILAPLERVVKSERIFKAFRYGAMIHRAPLLVQSVRGITQRLQVLRRKPRTAESPLAFICNAVLLEDRAQTLMSLFLDEQDRVEAYEKAKKRIYDDEAAKLTQLARN